MESDTRAAGFSKGVFTYLWYKKNLATEHEAALASRHIPNFTAFVAKVVHIFSNFNGSSFKAELEEYVNRHNMSRKNLFSFIAHYCFDYHAKNDDIFYVVLNTFAFLYIFAIFCYNKGHKEYIQFASMCWSEIFKYDLKEDFYANGGWVQFKKHVANISSKPKEINVLREEFTEGNIPHEYDYEEYVKERKIIIGTTLNIIRKIYDLPLSEYGRVTFEVSKESENYTSNESYEDVSNSSAQQSDGNSQAAVDGKIVEKSIANEQSKTYRHQMDKESSTKQTPEESERYACDKTRDEMPHESDKYDENASSNKTSNEEEIFEAIGNMEIDETFSAKQKSEMQHQMCEESPKQETPEEADENANDSAGGVTDDGCTEDGQLCGEHSEQETSQKSDEEYFKQRKKIIRKNLNTMKEIYNLPLSEYGKETFEVSEESENETSGESYEDVSNSSYQQSDGNSQAAVGRRINEKSIANEQSKTHQHQIDKELSTQGKGKHASENSERKNGEDSEAKRDFMKQVDQLCEEFSEQIIPHESDFKECLKERKIIIGTSLNILREIYDWPLSEYGKETSEKSENESSGESHEDVSNNSGQQSDGNSQAAVGRKINEKSIAIDQSKTHQHQMDKVPSTQETPGESERDACDKTRDKKMPPEGDKYDENASSNKTSNEEEMPRESDNYDENASDNKISNKEEMPDESYQYDEIPEAIDNMEVDETFSAKQKSEIQHQMCKESPEQETPEEADENASDSAEWVTDESSRAEEGQLCEETSEQEMPRESEEKYLKQRKKRIRKSLNAIRKIYNLPLSE